MNAEVMVEAGIHSHEGRLVTVGSEIAFVGQRRAGKLSDRERERRLNELARGFLRTWDILKEGTSSTRGVGAG